MSIFALEDRILNALFHLRYTVQQDPWTTAELSLNSYGSGWFYRTPGRKIVADMRDVRDGIAENLACLKWKA